MQMKFLKTNHTVEMISVIATRTSLTTSLLYTPCKPTIELIVSKSYITLMTLIEAVYYVFILREILPVTASRQDRDTGPKREEESMLPPKEGLCLPILVWWHPRKPKCQLE